MASNIQWGIGQKLDVLLKMEVVKIYNRLEYY